MHSSLIWVKWNGIIKGRFCTNGLNLTCQVQWGCYICNAEKGLRGSWHLKQQHWLRNEICMQAFSSLPLSPPTYSFAQNAKWLFLLYTALGWVGLAGKAIIASKKGSKEDSDASPPNSVFWLEHHSVGRYPTIISFSPPTVKPCKTVDKIQWHPCPFPKHLRLLQTRPVLGHSRGLWPCDVFKGPCYQVLNPMQA